jgi:hypothetical protein
MELPQIVDDGVKLFPPTGPCLDQTEAKGLGNFLRARNRRWDGLRRR